MNPKFKLVFCLKIELKVACQADRIFYFLLFVLIRNVLDLFIYSDVYFPGVKLLQSVLKVC